MHKPLHRYLLAALTACCALQAAAQDAAAPAAAASASAAASAAAAPAAPATAAAPVALDTRIQSLKAEVMQLNRDLLVLEEELLFPASTQLAVFVSVDVGQTFALESVQLKLGDKVVAQHLYTPLEVQALHRGGVQRLVLVNLKPGEHALTAFFTGRGPVVGGTEGGERRDYKRGTSLNFDKGTEPKYIELRISDSMAKLQPEFEVKVWQ
jgi:hypothetical protein